MLAFIGAVIVGFVVGLIARALMPGNQSMGFIMTTLLGMAGSLAANYIGQALNWYGPGEAPGWIASVLGAVLLLFIYGLATGKGKG